jgi:hypothetical protein
MLHVPDESLEIQRVIANSMSCYTFAIVQPSSHGTENRELATGVGVRWKGAHLILTAGHVVEHCPEDTLRFFLPEAEIQFLTAGGRKTAIDVQLRKLYELEHPKPPILADDVDLAAVLLPQQLGAEQHFYWLEESSKVPAERTQVGIFGYPAAAKVLMNKNYVASPEHFFGSLNASGDACRHKPIQDFTVPYELAHRANGYSGSGLWYWPSTPVWSPAALLAGIIASECTVDHVVSGYNIETIIRFLDERTDFIFAK